MPSALIRCERFANAHDADFDHVVGQYPVSQFPQLEYSKKEVVRAGEALKGQIAWVPDKRGEILRIFEVANSWRVSHAFPMHRMRNEMHGRMSAINLKGLTAARLKQMPSIRGKLARLDGNLRQLQDLGGCRAVVPTMANARALVGSIKDRFAHDLKRDDPYMDMPRDSGYRSHHLVFAFAPRNKTEESYKGRLIELQIRSRLQHSWATAVEAVGLYRGENLKASEGNQDWLRLFGLMSLELARCEGCEYAQDGRDRRVAEIIDLNNKLSAIQTLDALAHAVSGVDRYLIDPNYKPQFCLITYDHEKRVASLKYLNSPSEIKGAYGTIEQDDQRSGSNKFSAVLVEVDKIQDLREAYPNYFGDVQLFKSNLSEIVLGNDAKEYSLPPLERVPPPPKEIPDDSWLRKPRFRWS